MRATVVSASLFLTAAAFVAAQSPAPVVESVPAPTYENGVVTKVDVKGRLLTVRGGAVGEARTFKVMGDAVVALAELKVGASVILLMDPASGAVRDIRPGDRPLGNSPVAAPGTAVAPARPGPVPVPAPPAVAPAVPVGAPPEVRGGVPDGNTATTPISPVPGPEPGTVLVGTPGEVRGTPVPTPPPVSTPRPVASPVHPSPAAFPTPAPVATPRPVLVPSSAPSPPPSPTSRG